MHYLTRHRPSKFDISIENTKDSSSEEACPFYTHYLDSSSESKESLSHYSDLPLLEGETRKKKGVLRSISSIFTCCVSSPKVKYD